MKIRKANKNDKEFIKELHKQHKKHIGNFNLFWVWDKYLEGNTNYTYEIYENNGFIRYGYSKKYKANVIYEIAVNNKSTEKGVGRKLFNRLKKPIFLKCNEDNEIGNKFYLKMGMTKAGSTLTKKGEKQNVRK